MNYQTQDELNKLRNDVARLVSLDTLESLKELISIYLDFMIVVIKRHHKSATKSHREAVISIFMQMIFSKTLHIQKSLSGMNYRANGISLNSIIDPVIINTVVRNLFETVCAFNCIYVQPQTDDQKELIYLLWECSSLKYRSEFKEQATREESKEQVLREQDRINRIRLLIEKLPYYNSLNNKAQNKIQSRLKTKEYLISFNESDIKCLRWKDIASYIGVKNEVVPNIYNYFSLNAHPSFISISQFGRMFNGTEFIKASKFSIECMLFFVSIFISDFITVRPEVISTFNSLSIRDQCVINFFNIASRGLKHSINDSWKELGTL